MGGLIERAGNPPWGAIATRDMLWTLALLVGECDKPSRLAADLANDPEKGVGSIGGR